MEEKVRLNNSKRVAIAGILTALGAVSLFLENVLPTGKLGFYVFAGFVLSIVIMECGLAYGWVSYAAVSLLSFLLVPEKTAVLPYALFFGLYSMMKSHIERLDKIIFEWILKFVFFNLSLYFIWNVAVSLLLIPENILNSFSVYLIAAVLQVAFFLFDWIFTFWIQYYHNKIQPKLHR